MAKMVGRQILCSLHGNFLLGLTLFPKTIFKELFYGLEGGNLIGTIKRYVDARTTCRRQHHHAHDAFGINVTPLAFE